MRTGIFGGTFDPIHLGHLIIAEAAADELKLDRVILMPSHISYLKEGREDGVSSAADRLAMTYAAAGSNPHFAVSDMEIQRGGNSYTYETLEAFHAADPDEKLYYIVGADTICGMGSWRFPERIFPHCIVVGALRPDQVDMVSLMESADRLRAEYRARIQFLDVPAIGISSTQIRSRVREGKSIRYLVPEAVESYIEDRGLYRLNTEPITWARN